MTWSAIASVDRWDGSTKKEWREKGYQEILNSRTKQVMKVSTNLLDDIEENREKLDILKSASQLRVPMLVVHGGSDETVSAEDADEIASSAGNGSLVRIKSATHTMNAAHPLVTIPWQLELAVTLTAHFIKTFGFVPRRKARHSEQ